MSTEESKSNKHSEEKKFATYDSDSEEDLNECILTPENDRRRSIRQTSNKNDGIIQCMGTVETRFVIKTGNYTRTETKYGTGTVIHIDNNNTIYVLSAAHNISGVEKQCPQCYISTMRKRCPTCTIKTKKTHQLLQPDHIYFVRRGNGDKYILGAAVATYDADNFKFPPQYYQYPKPDHGYDVCIIMFKCYDDPGRKLYRENTVKISLVHDMKFGGKENTIYIYGYPKEFKKPTNNGLCHVLYGMGTGKFDKTIKLNTKQNDETKKLILVNDKIDTSAGQSGCCIYSYRGNDTKQFFIYGVHTSGGKKNGKILNYGTMFDEGNLMWIKSVFTKNKIYNISNRIIYLNMDVHANNRHVDDWKLKHINEWSCQELQQWIHSSDLSKNMQTKLCQFIIEQDVNGQDFNSMNEIKEIVASFQIEDIDAVLIYSALELVRKNCNTIFVKNQRILCNDTRYKNQKRKYYACIIQVEDSRVKVRFIGYPMSEDDWIPKHEWSQRITII